MRTLCLFFTICATASAQPSIADIRLDDGSSVRMTLAAPSVEIETKYGKLTIPVADIRKIEFGLHVPIEKQESIDKAVKRLASVSHKERTTASVELVGYGHFAAPALRLRSADQETTIRTAEVLRLIGERVSADLLVLRDVDVIYTAEHPIHGKIAVTSIKASSPHFGEVDLQLSAIRSLSLKHAGGNRDIVIDAAKNGKELDQWLDTSIHLERGAKLTVQAEGQVDLWPQTPGQYIAAPKGYNLLGKGSQYMAGALIGRVGADGRVFLIGERYDAGTTDQGNLYLLILPSPWNNVSSGNYRVKIDVK